MTEFNKVFFDTAPFIYYLERNEFFFDKVKSFFQECYRKQIEFVTLTITVEEYCVYPYRNMDLEQVYRFEKFLNDLNFTVLDITNEIAHQAAKIRADFKDFKAMDSFQLSCAVCSSCDLYFGNDKQLLQFSKIPVITIDQL